MKFLVLIPFFVIMAACLFMIYRNHYVHARLISALNAVHTYGQYLIRLGMFDDAIHAYDMLMEYDELFYSVTVWGPYIGVKPEYRELIAPYFEG